MNSRVIILGVVLLVYLLVELYIYFNLRLVIRETRWQGLYWGLYLATLLFVLVSVGIFMSGLNQSDSETFQHRTPAGNFAIGLTFTLIFSKMILGSIFLVIDISRFLLWIVDLISERYVNTGIGQRLESRRTFVVKMGLGLAAIPFASFLYGITFGKYNYKVKKVTLSFPNLNPEFNGYKIVQISDIHAGSFDDKESVTRGVRLINDQDADLVVFTGDLVNDRADEIDGYIDVFREIQSKDGIFSITGNHDYGDYYKWNSQAEKEANFNRLVRKHAEIGFEILMNENRQIEKGNGKINIVGVENWGLPPFPQKGDLEKALDGVDDSFTLLLSHDPSHWDEEVLKYSNKVDLTLSGHTHGMQFGIEIPGVKWSPVKYKYPRWAGLYNSNDQYLYVNRGFGFLGLPGRVGIWPEITVIELKSEA